MRQLAPCPFCGGPAELIRQKAEGGKTAHWVACTDSKNCHVIVRTQKQYDPEKGKDLAIDLWNKRA